MPVDPKPPQFNGDPEAGSASPPAVNTPPFLSADSPPPLSPQPTIESSPARRLIAVLLSLCLGLFLADGAVSLVDDSLILFFGIHVLGLIRGVLFFFAALIALVVYGLMGLTPMIPKCLFLPVVLFTPLAQLVVIPFLIYFYSRCEKIAWVTSFCEVLCGLSVLYRVQGGFKFRWPLIAGNRLEARRFSWRNLSAFLLVNLFMLLPAAVGYLCLCAALAVNHFSEGFLALRPGGLTVQVRRYVRDDGKTIQLVPMSHIGEPDFYRKLSQSFPTNAIILMEGVTDRRHLLTNGISYQRVAASLGVAEQVKEFKPSRERLVRADVDVEQFAPTTIDFLNRVMLIYSKGLNAENVQTLIQNPPAPEFQEQLLDDLLRKRNRRLLDEIQSRLPQSEYIIVPWGAAHMPEIAREIQKSGFRLQETREYTALRFRSVGNKSRNAGTENDTGEPK
ncbi:MAG TPA: hypothetical protein VN887_20825 [Candidatus Angelobacter sp.]|nr:hypothetical protein [Candidatus Angelobacter sp.]